MSKQILIVGAGWSGSVIARKLADAGCHVTIVEERDHIGGNCYDFTNEYGELIHKYGPHLMHHNNDRVHEFLLSHGNWGTYEHRVKALHRYKQVDLPVNLGTLRHMFGNHDKDVLVQKLEDAKVNVEVTNTDELFLASYGHEISNIFFRPYTKLMWDCDPSEIEASVGARLKPRMSEDDRYFLDKYQYMPEHGYTKIFESILDHENITVKLSTSADSIESESEFDHVFTSQSPDSYYDYVLGELPYRSIKFRNITTDEQIVWPMNAPTVNFTRGKYTRVTEWKKLPNSGGTNGMCTRTYEEPCWDYENNGAKFYPLKTEGAKETLREYKKYHTDPDVTFIGRTGNYAYLDMWQAILGAMVSADKYLAKD